MPQIPPIARAGLLLVTLLATAPVCLAVDPAPGVTVIGGVADAARQVVYLSDPDRGLVAVNIDTGKELWDTKEATRAVASLGKNVYAFAMEKGKPNVFRVVTLDADSKGKLIRKSDPITLPEWADIADANDRFVGAQIFSCQTTFKDGTLTILWGATSLNARKFAAGLATVDLASGKVKLESRPDGPRRKDKAHPEGILKVIFKRNWNSADPIVETGGRVFGRFGSWDSTTMTLTLTLQVADLKSKDLLWERIILKTRGVPSK